jgi:hypothetical protein
MTLDDGPHLFFGPTVHCTPVIDVSCGLAIPSIRAMSLEGGIARTGSRFFGAFTGDHQRALIAKLRLIAQVGGSHVDLHNTRAPAGALRSALLRKAQPRAEWPIHAADLDALPVLVEDNWRGALFVPRHFPLDAAFPPGRCVKQAEVARNGLAVGIRDGPVHQSSVLRLPPDLRRPGGGEVQSCSPGRLAPADEAPMPVSPSPH